MNSTQLGTVALITALVLLPQLIALYLSGPRKSKPEHEYDYR